MKIIPDEIEHKSITIDMPRFEQYPGACGLTSLLMALRPQKHSVNEILNNLWEKISTEYDIHSNLDISKNWQIVLEWLLFKTVENENLQKILSKSFGNIFFESMLPLLKFGIEEKIPRFSDVGSGIDEIPLKINNEWLMRRVYVWKQNFELSILFNFFGYEFIPWTLNQDGTGALFFTSKELKKQNDEYKQKLQFLLDRVEHEDPILCCESIHWIAIKDFQEKKNDVIVIYHDPATASENLRLLKYFRESDRFYVFQFNSQLYESYLEILQSL